MKRGMHVGEEGGAGYVKPREHWPIFENTIRQGGLGLGWMSGILVA